MANHCHLIHSLWATGQDSAGPGTPCDMDKKNEVGDIVAIWGGGRMRLPLFQWFP
jgi:hypothetical protein